MSADRAAPRGAGDGAALRTVAVSAGYGGRAVIHEVSITAAPGAVTSIVGPNGSGKSTLLKSIVGVVRVLAGTVLHGQQPITNAAPEDIARRGVGYVPQVDDVFGPLSVRENLEMGGYLLPRREVAARVAEVVAFFPQLGRMLGRRAGKLSGGERKMLAMARVLMVRPDVFVLDEPTANLAPAVARTVLEEQVRTLAATGAAVLIVEQRAKAVLAISDHTYVLGGGRLRMAGRPAELATDPAFVESFLGGRGPFLGGSSPGIRAGAE